VPNVSVPAETVIVALPLLKAVDGEVNVPDESVTEPVGMGFPPPPLTATVALNPCVVLMDSGEGVTVTVGSP